MSDPFAHFGEQERSWSIVPEIAPSLAEEARLVLSKHPGAQLCGVIIDSAAPEAKAFIALYEQATGQPCTQQFVTTVWPRHKIVENLRGTFDALLEHFPSQTEDSFPILVIFKHGMRFKEWPLGG